MSLISNSTPIWFLNFVMLSTLFPLINKSSDIHPDDQYFTSFMFKVDIMFIYGEPWILQTPV